MDGSDDEDDNDDDLDSDDDQEAAFTVSLLSGYPWYIIRIWYQDIIGVLSGYPWCIIRICFYCYTYSIVKISFAYYQDILSILSLSISWIIQYIFCFYRLAQWVDDSQFYSLQRVRRNILLYQIQ